MTRKAPGAGTRIIGQVARHEINLEIEDVLDKKIKINKGPHHRGVMMRG